VPSPLSTTVGSLLAVGCGTLTWPLSCCSLNHGAGSVTAPLMSWRPPGCSSCVTNSPCCAARHHGPSSSPPTEPCSLPSAASCPDHAGRVSSSGRRRCCAGTDASSLVPGPTRTADHRAAHLRGPGPLAAHPGQRQPPANHSAATTVTGPPPPPARPRPDPSALTNPRTQCIPTTPALDSPSCAKDPASVAAAWRGTRWTGRGRHGRGSSAASGGSGARWWPGPRWCRAGCGRPRSGRAGPAR
jgi:hypothetical protein